MPQQWHSTQIILTIVLRSQPLFRIFVLSSRVALCVRTHGVASFECLFLSERSCFSSACSFEILSFSTVVHNRSASLRIVVNAEGGEAASVRACSCKNSASFRPWAILARLIHRSVFWVSRTRRLKLLWIPLFTVVCVKIRTGTTWRIANKEMWRNREPQKVYTAADIPDTGLEGAKLTISSHSQHARDRLDHQPAKASSDTFGQRSQAAVVSFEVWDPNDTCDSIVHLKPQLLSSDSDSCTEPVNALRCWSHSLVAICIPLLVRN
jgi:hypothetical protein